jgi:hypothetical protein
LDLRSCSAFARTAVILNAGRAGASMPADDVTFHTLAGFGIGHVAARGLGTDLSGSFQARDVRATLRLSAAGAGADPGVRWDQDGDRRVGAYPRAAVARRGLGADSRLDRRLAGLDP